MGFFSKAVDFVSSKVSDISATVVKGIKKAQEVAVKALGWMAEHAEGFVGSVKKVWSNAKPYVDKFALFLDMAAKVAPYPWLKTALTVLSKTLIALTAFENSPIAKKIDAAIKWAIKLAKMWQQRREQNTNNTSNQQESEVFDENDISEAKAHQSTFRTADAEPSIDLETKRALKLAAAINDFEIARTELKNALAGEPQSFEHYLRLRATQKLLNMAEKKFNSAQTIDDLSQDDLFLLEVASDLIKANPELSDVAATRLDQILKNVCGRALTPFVFEELVASWSLRAKSLENEWEIALKALSKDKVLLKTITLAKQIQDKLSLEEETIYSELQITVPQKQLELDQMLNELSDVNRYVGAVEGFLQLLEKDEAQLIKEERDYLIYEGEQVGILLIKCAENDIAYNSLSEDEQALITDYANIFKADSGSRIERVLEAVA